MATTTRQSDADRMRRKRASERDIKIPALTRQQKVRRTRLEKDIYAWLEWYFADLFDQPFTRDRKAMVGAILEATRSGGDQAIAASRGEGKTSIAECVCLYCVLTGVVRFPLIVAALHRDAQRILDNVKHYLMRSERLAEDYPEVCEPIRALEGAPQRAGGQTADGAPTFIAWKQDQIVFPTVEGSRCSGSVICTRSLEGHIRGIRVGILRPDLVVIDDPETPASAGSEEQTDARENTIEQDVGGLGGPGKPLARVMLCTIVCKDCLADRYTDTKRKASWKGKRYQFVETWPEREDLWEEYCFQRQKGQQEGDDTGRGAHAFYLKNRKLMDAGAKVSNPHRFNPHLEDSALEHAFNIIADRGMTAFMTELQNSPPEEEEWKNVDRLNPATVQQAINGEKQRVVPDDATAITVGVDIGGQAGHFTAIAWKPDATGFIVSYGVMEIWAMDRTDDMAKDRATIGALRTLVEDIGGNPYKRGDDAAKIDLMVIDSGYRTEAVYAFCREQNPFPCLPVKGMSQPGRDLSVVGRVGKRKRGRAHGDNYEVSALPKGGKLIVANVDHWKKWTHDRFREKPRDPGSLSIFGNNPKDHRSFAHHICAEEWVEETNKNTGRETKYWAKRNDNNHWLDATTYACVAASLLGVKLAMGREPARVSRRRVISAGRTRPDGRRWA